MVTLEEKMAVVQAFIGHCLNEPTPAQVNIHQFILNPMNLIRLEQAYDVAVRFFHEDKRGSIQLIK